MAFELLLAHFRDRDPINDGGSLGPSGLFSGLFLSSSLLFWWHFCNVSDVLSILCEKPFCWEPFYLARYTKAYKSLWCYRPVNSEIGWESFSKNIKKFREIKIMHAMSFFNEWDYFIKGDLLKLGFGTIFKKMRRRDVEMSRRHWFIHC